MWKQKKHGNTIEGERPSERQVLRSLGDVLAARLPPTWSFDFDLEPRSGAPRAAARPDAVLELRAPDGAAARVLVECKRRLDPRDVPGVLDQMRWLGQFTDAQARLVAAPFLSPRTRQTLETLGVSYTDGTGNLRIALDRPALFLETVGADSDPWTPEDARPLRSLKGPAAGRVVRALCDLRPPYGVQELAQRSGTPLGSVSRVLAFLESEALIVRQPRGPVMDVTWPDLIRRWTQDYQLQKSNRVRTYLEPRGLPALLEKLRHTTQPYAVTGSLAAVQVVPIAPSRLATVYVDDLPRAAEELRLRAADAGANVLLAEPFDPVVFERGREGDGVRYAALSQVVADLLTSPGRGPSEGEELMRWMEAHEDAWRT